MRFHRSHTCRMLVGAATAVLAISQPARAAQQQITYGHQALDTLPIEAPRHLSGSIYSTRFPDVKWDNKAWTLTTTTLRPNDYHAVTSTANGYFGASMASTGPFFQSFAEMAGWPVFNQRQTFGTVSGFWDRQARTKSSNFPWLEQNGLDSVISGIPHWGPLIVELADGSYLAANTSTDQFSNIHLVQDYKQGLTQWQYTWAPFGQSNTTFNITYVAFTHKLDVNRAYVRLVITPSQDANVTIYNILDGRNALRTAFKTSGSDGNMIYTAVSPNGVENVTAWMYSAISESTSSAQSFTGSKSFIGNVPSTIVQSLNLSLKTNQLQSVLKHVGVASSDGFSDPQGQAKNAILDSLNNDFDAILAGHVEEWQYVLPPGSVVDYSDPVTGLLPTSRPELIEKAMVSVVSSFSLLQNTVSENALSMVKNATININGISVCGLTSDCYGGQLFWDNDVWMGPIVQAVFPTTGKQITNARVKQYPQAKRNIAAAFDSSRKNTNFNSNAAAYPWTSGRDANCTATGPCFDYEYHLNGDIVRSFISQWASSGDTKYLKNDLYPIMQSVSAFYSDLLVKNGSSWQLLNMTDPDKYYNNVDNGAFTMPLIAYVLNGTNSVAEYFGDAVNSRWQDQAQNIFIPRSGDLSLEFESMNGSVVVKQADVILKIFPLEVQLNYSIAQQLADLDYYAGHQSPQGPGMTYAIFSIAANKISPSGCSAYAYDRYSWSPYVREPWFAFSEQLIDEPGLNGGTNPAFPFLTGHGGFLQIDLYGYLGLRRNVDWVLNIDPSLPPQIPNLGFPTFFHHGWPIQARANQTHTTLTRLGQPLPTANMTFANSPITVVLIEPEANNNPNNTYSLQPSGSIVVPNRMYSANKTEPGDILQCQPVRSSTSSVPGAFALAAIDGAVSTVWQGATANSDQSLTVDTSDVPFQQLQYASFNWAQQPPKLATIVLHNYTDWSTGQMINISNINVSSPFNPKPQVAIVPYEGNATKIKFNESVWSSNYVTLITNGNQGNSSKDAPGASIAAFALVPIS